MPDVARCFNDQGLAEFSRWLRNGAPGPVPSSLLADTEFSAPLAQSQIPEIPTFKDRYEFGLFLVDLLGPYDPHLISYNRGLWSWLAALFFEQLAPADAEGKRSLRRPYVYVLSESRLYYRHLVRGPWYLISTPLHRSEDWSPKTGGRREGEGLSPTAGANRKPVGSDLRYPQDVSGSAHENSAEGVSVRTQHLVVIIVGNPTCGGG